MQGVRNTMWTAVAVLAASAIAPAAASAAGASVTGDDGNPVTLGGAVTIRQMAPKVFPLFVPGEKNYTLAVLDPAGAPAARPVECIGTGFPINPRVDYAGNGAYTVVVTTYTDTGSGDRCETGKKEQRLPFTINASTVVGPLPTQLLQRDPGVFGNKDYAIPVQMNPGADRMELRFLNGGQIGPDGGIAGPSQEGLVLSSSGTASIRFDAPGRYVFVARAKVITASGDRFSPWSQSVAVQVYAPFDHEVFRITDSTGPSYRVRLTLREKSATGKVKIAMARGKKGGKFRSIGSAPIRKGVISKRFRQRRYGIYRLRFTYAGGATTAPGQVIEGLRFRKVIRFRRR